MSITLDNYVIVYAPNTADPWHGRARTVIERLATGPDNDIPVVHLVALMLQIGVRRIITRDRGFRRFDGIEVLDLTDRPTHG